MLNQEAMDVWLQTQIELIQELYTDMSLLEQRVNALTEKARYDYKQFEKRGLSSITKDLAYMSLLGSREETEEKFTKTHLATLDDLIQFERKYPEHGPLTCLTGLYSVFEPRTEYVARLHSDGPIDSLQRLRSLIAPSRKNWKLYSEGMAKFGVEVGQCKKVLEKTYVDMLRAQKLLTEMPEIFYGSSEEIQNVISVMYSHMSIVSDGQIGFRHSIPNRTLGLVKEMELNTTKGRSPSYSHMTIKPSKVDSHKSAPQKIKNSLHYLWYYNQSRVRGTSTSGYDMHYLSQIGLETLDKLPELVEHFGTKSKALTALADYGAGSIWSRVNVNGAYIMDKPVEDALYIYELAKNYDLMASIYLERGRTRKAIQVYVRNGQLEKAAQLHLTFGEKIKAAQHYLAANLPKTAAEVYEDAGMFSEAEKVYQQQGMYSEAKLAKLQRIKAFHKQIMVIPRSVGCLSLADVSTIGGLSFPPGESGALSLVN